MTTRFHTLTLTLTAVLGLAVTPAFAQTTVTDKSEKEATAAPATEAPTAAEAPKAPAAPSVAAPKAPEPPKPTGPTYNPPPPSGKDWGKLPQEAREQVLNDWKALPEKDREPFIFYRERAMAKLPDSAYSDNPYKPEAPESPNAAAVKGAATMPVTATTTTTEEKSTGGSLMDKLFGGKDDEKSAE